MEHVKKKILLKIKKKHAQNVLKYKNMQKYFVKFCSTFSLQSFFFFENYPLQAYRVSKTYICGRVGGGWSIPKNAFLSTPLQQPSSIEQNPCKIPAFTYKHRLDFYISVNFTSILCIRIPDRIIPRKKEFIKDMILKISLLLRTEYFVIILVAFLIILDK